MQQEPTTSLLDFILKVTTDDALLADYEQDAEAVIKADPDLTAEQKGVLLSRNYVIIRNWMESEGSGDLSTAKVTITWGIPTIMLTPPPPPPYGAAES